MADAQYSPNLDDLVRMMSDTDEGPFMTAVTNLLRHVDQEHVMDENGNCVHDGCQSPYGEPEFSADWPCSWWLLAQRCAVAWLLERAQGVDKSPEERQREAARERKRRQRERESQESTAPQAVEPCPQGTDGGVPQGLPGGLAEASQGRSQGGSQSDGKSDGNRVASAMANAEQVP